MKRLDTKTWIIVAVVVLLIVVGATAGVANKTSTSGFCSSCHAYEKMSWDHGDHKEVSCISCHTKGSFNDKNNGIRKVMLTTTGKVDPHRDNLPSYKDEIINNCKGCHMSDEIRQERPIFTARHDEYLQHYSNCMGCHDPGHKRSYQTKRFVGSGKTNIP